MTSVVENQTANPRALPRARGAEHARTGSLLREASLIVALYLGYVSARLLANGDALSARHHADEILHVERWLYLDFEAATNAFFSSSVWLAAPVSYWYAALHYLVTPTVLIWLFLRYRGLYNQARTGLVLTSAIGLVGFLLYPTAPPRLVAGYVDTLARYDDIGWWSAHASAPRGFGQFTNELAAMPSLHCGWALWVAWAVLRTDAARWLKITAVGYAAGTAAVVVVNLLNAAGRLAAGPRHSGDGGQRQVDSRDAGRGLHVLLALGATRQGADGPGPGRGEEPEVTGVAGDDLRGELAARVQQPDVRRRLGLAVSQHLTLDHGLRGRVEPRRGARALPRGTTHGRPPSRVAPAGAAGG
jgi:hypothetical protein